MKIIKKKQILFQQNLSNIFEITMGQSPSSEFYTKNTLDIPFHQGVSNFTNKYPIDSVFTTISKKNAHKNDILLSVRAPVGRINLANKSISIGRGLCSLKLKKYTNIDYFYYIMKNMENSWEKISNGSIFDSVNKNEIENFNVCYHENFIQQNNIAKILYKQEEQIETIKRLIKNVEKRNQYYSEKLLSGELRLRTSEETGQVEFYENTEWKEEMVNGVLTQIPSDWVVNKVLEHISLTKGISINSSLFNYENKGFVFLRTGDVWEDSSSKKETVFFDGAIDEKYIKKEEDYVACFEGFNKKINEGTIGLVTNTGEGIISSHLYKIKNKNINGQYCSISLIKNINIQTLLMRHAVGSTVLSSTKCLKDLEFSFPFKEEEFMLMEKILASEYQSYEQLKKLLPKEEKRFQWMLDNLLSGEYEVIDED